MNEVRISLAIKCNIPLLGETTGTWGASPETDYKSTVSICLKRKDIISESMTHWHTAWYGIGRWLYSNAEDSCLTRELRLLETFRCARLG